MNLTNLYIPLGTSGSLVFLEPEGKNISQDDSIRRRVQFATYFLGKRIEDGSTVYQFKSSDAIQSVPSLSFYFPDPSSADFLNSVKQIGRDLIQVLSSANLVVFYPPEYEERVREIFALIILGNYSQINERELGLPDQIFGRPFSDWKKEFLEIGFQVFKSLRSLSGKNSITTHPISASSEKLKEEGTVAYVAHSLDKPKLEPKQSATQSNNSPESISGSYTTGSIKTGNLKEIKTDQDSDQAKESSNGNISAVNTNAQSPNTSNSNIQNKENSLPTIAPKNEQTPKQPESKDSSKEQNTVAVKSQNNSDISSNSSIAKDSSPESKIEHVKAESPSQIQDSAAGNKTKFSIQVKMMGIISLILAITVSIIIGIATYFFKQDSETRVQENNLALVDLVGLKVSSDIQGIVTKAEQLIANMIRTNLTAEDKRFINELFFQSDKDFLFVGLMRKSDAGLVADQKFFNEESLIEIGLSEDDVAQNILRNSEAIEKALTGKPLIINSTPGFSVQSFILAVPTNQESGIPKILVVMVKLDKIASAFTNKGIITTFMVNDEGRVIAHPVEEVILSSTSFLDSPIVKAMLASQVDQGQIRYKSPEGRPFMGSYQKIGFGDAGIVSIVSEDKAFQAVYRIQERNIYILIISLCLALVIVFFFAKSLSRPILTLLHATLEIAKGNFRMGIKPTTKDEVGLLTSYFITMGEGLEEREKVKSILGSMIDPVVVKEAMVDLAALKRGKEAEITAFFSDVAGFSTISEQLTSVELASLLNEYLSAMTILLKENEGVLDKYIGDAIVGIFGAPVEVEKHAFKACKASLEMVIKLADLRAYWQKNNLYSKEAQIMDARIGLNTGPAKVGFMGTDALASYTMMGDTVNLAARLEAAGKDYGVNIMIAEKTVAMVQGEMFTRLLDLVRVKGKNEPVKVYELVNFETLATSSQKEFVGLYEEGFSLYLSRQWDSAIKKFEDVSRAKGSKDKSAKMILDRCLDYKSNPPQEDWDGVFTRTTK
ncbi:adenylate/guanylate cyclase domain-containing protein [Leptospira sp. GIMC2001]|uniref:adenylate/guanylate cyclase domain-containing protein n=1 Tax=Leptospira sp. GIMC2001 TaxID=1513297 RepID=UPI00234A53EE|nr:adenylate/guanylate cyclase domain-containing protein [Leptospira sp. GIMC2001]WCL48065.1 HAMP domain-containing protein [Leptospira sp. GIMC2001]